MNRSDRLRDSRRGFAFRPFFRLADGASLPNRTKIQKIIPENGHYRSVVDGLLEQFPCY
jgi:hypothetical protein